MAIVTIVGLVMLSAWFKGLELLFGTPKRRALLAGVAVLIVLWWHGWGV